LPSTNGCFGKFNLVVAAQRVPIQQLVGEDLDSSDDKELIKMFRQVGTLEQNDRDAVDDLIRGMIKRKRERDSGN